MKIQFSDLNSQHKEIKKEIELAIKKVIAKGDFILGADVSLFEKEFAAVCNAKFAVGVSSGTAALFLACLSLDIKNTDEVIVPAFTYIATALAVSYTGAKPVFVDIDERTYNIDAAKIKDAITRNTKAIIPVHLFGQPADMSEILKIAKDYGLKVIEDAAQAHGARIKTNGRWLTVGGIGDIGCFSFYPSKNLGGLGDGGMIITNSEKIYKKIRMLRDYGRISKYEHAVIGYNSRLDTLQAAILRCKLKKLSKWNAMRRKAALIYDSILKKADVITPYVEKNVKHVYHVYAIRTKKRDRLFNLLKEKGISTIIHYALPLHLQKAYRNLGYKTGDFPVSEKIAQEVISLPMYAHLARSQIEYVCKWIKKRVK
jgi:dTDP-4-amino-4,6-dideoxygalactose transaminase